MTMEKLSKQLPQIRQQGLSALFHFLAYHIHEARLANGNRVLDASDFKEWLHSVGDIFAETSGIRFPSSSVRNRVLEDTCPRCGHIHQGVIECGEQIGGGRVCRCELAVPA